MLRYIKRNIVTLRGLKTMAYISWIRKSRYQRLIFLSIIFLVIVVVFILHGTILNLTSSSLVSNKNDRWWARLKLGNESVVIPVIYSGKNQRDGGVNDKEDGKFFDEENRRQDNIAEVRGTFNRNSYDKMDILEKDSSLMYDLDRKRISSDDGAKGGGLLGKEGDHKRGHGGSLDSSPPQLRVVHLDFKGAPPKLSYIRTLLPLIAAAGANALLIEYEDMFPFEGSLRNISALNAYTKKQVLQMLSWAKNLGMEVIPLIQTFGHLEYALKLSEFQHLRELAAFPQELCPSNSDSFVLVQELVRQVMALHPSARFVHVGCDEVYHLAACGRCTKRRLDGRALFIEHVTRVATHVRTQYPGVTPLVWDDMFRQWAPMELADSGLGPLVEPVVWVYIDDITHLVPHYVWYMYGQSFTHVWVASAFKGAFGETQIVPDLNRHFRNHLAWLRLMDSKSQKEPHATTPTIRNFRGIVLTGWSRYDHFAVLCELLPPSLPSLLLNLLIVSHKRSDNTIVGFKTSEEEGKTMDHVFGLWLQHLQCPSSYSRVSLPTLTSDPYQWRLGTCSFPGSNLYASIASYISLKSRVKTVYHEVTESNGWMTRYNVQHNYSSPFRVLNAFSSTGGHMLVQEVSAFRNATARVLTQYFDRFTVEEWLEQKVDSLHESLYKIEKAVQKLIKFDTWPRRPLT